MTRAQVTNGTPKPERATNLSLGTCIVAFANTIMQLIVSFGLNISVQQEASITAVLNATILLALALSHVYAQITAERERWSHMNGVDR